MADVVDLILAGHARVRRLFAVLEDAARLGEQPGAREMLSEAWARLDGLLELHADAEEEICYPALFGHGPHATADIHAAIAGHDDIREAVAEARRHDVGSLAWWRAVSTAGRISGEHREVLERGVLADFRRRADQGLRDDLGRRWAAFIAARSRDARVRRPGPPGSRRPPARVARSPDLR
ncbi:MAG: hemerythrin domain-containing protein [Streptosporangiaceae bacterium]